MALPGVSFKRLLPAAAVAAVLAASFMAVPPSLASSTNNCGVKGYGYHDHGKVCPNRPFPGKGEGLEKFLGGAETAGGSNAKTETEGIAVTTTDNDTVATGGGV